MVGKKSLGTLFAGLLIMQCTMSLNTAEAAYAVEDSVVRQNTKQILSELNSGTGKTGNTGNSGIHGDTTSIDQTTKAILETVSKIWRQSEQQARKMDEVDTGKGLGNVMKDLGSGALTSFIGGSCVKIDDVLKPLQDKDKLLHSALQKAISGEKWNGQALFSGTGWSGIKDTLKSQLTSELDKVLKQSMSKTVFPELSTSEILAIAKGGSATTNSKIKEFYSKNFPKLEINDVKGKTPDAVQASRDEKKNQIEASVSNSRQSVTQTIMQNNALMQRNLTQMQKMSDVYENLEGQAQRDQMKAKIDLLATMNNSYAAFNQSAMAQQQLNEWEAQDKLRQNQEAADEAVLSAAGSYKGEYADKVDKSLFKGYSYLK